MARVTEVKLSERSRTRLNQEIEAHRATKPHDIRMAIPQGVDWTNPAKFPPYMFREYPKMPLLDNNQPIVIDDSGTILVFFDATDEADFKVENPDIAEEIERNAPSKTMAQTLAAQQEQIDMLKERLRAAGLDLNDAGAAAPKKNALARAVQAAAPKVEEAPAETSGGLRDTLPRNHDAAPAVAPTVSTPAPNKAKSSNPLKKAS